MPKFVCSGGEYGDSEEIEAEDAVSAVHQFVEDVQSDGEMMEGENEIKVREINEPMFFTVDVQINTTITCDDDDDDDDDGSSFTEAEE